MTFWFFVTGLVEKSDSIAYDLLCQQRLLSELHPGAATEIVAREVRREHYPQPVTPWADYLARGVRPGPDDVVIYHYGDGWDDFEDHAQTLDCRRRIWRWHNNTPPWFFMDQADWVANTLRGYHGVLRALQRGGWLFATNSRFSSRQLQVLACGELQQCVVHPASLLLDDGAAPVPRAPPAHGPLKLLFVGRLMPHKSHGHVVDLAGMLARRLGRDVEVHLAGRAPNAEYPAYLDALAAARSGVTLTLHGEVDDAGLRALYGTCHVFVCLSQHEGFGLPVYEAMRQGLPVMAALTSAFDELLAGHPLCLPGSDLSVFAERLAQLVGDPALQQAVQRHQHGVLQQYSAHTLREQLAAMLAGGTPLAGTATEQPLRYHFDRSFDPDRQCVTRDDLQIFERLAPRAPAPARRVLQVGRWQYLEPTEFSAPRPRRIEPDLSWAFDAADDLRPGDCLFAGPHLLLPPGLYRVQLGFDAELPAGGAAAVLEADCLAAGHHLMRRQAIEVPPHGTRRAGQIEFYAELPHDIGRQTVEFRCHAPQGWPPGLRFWFKWLGLLPIQL
ncbi:glycosyltransferase family 4 protein [Piscinibacter sakaiensis]|uniref:Glycosyl transferase family 1 domain-containing protein n=1 Tax=Piscinibacter sakaiensis TaxID=1547922 RepID=A0A0K8P7N2_PISS1|nr:glycosyltransferase family 4 protein [Piscinibacter sakaiensis]GAP38642.1 hypothetical protein ISF6_5195 [Piscinibacter sakaiensis]